jgi:hypothetical protein
MAIGFAQTAIELTAEKWEAVEKYNAGLERLLARRKSEVTVTGPLIESKTAWKCAVLQQALLYRVTMLATGCAESWNSGNVVCSILAGRALLETITLSIYVADELVRYAEVRDVEAIEKLANEQLFSTKDEKMIAEGAGYLAPSVLKYIDKFDKKIDGVRNAYEFLCEWCHPNGSGHLMTYGAINKQTGTVAFSEATSRVKGIQGHVISCFMLILFIEPMMDKFDWIIPRAAEIDPNQGPWLPFPARPSP